MESLEIAGNVIAPGKTVQLEIPVARLYTDTQIHIPVYVVRSRTDGPNVFVTAAIHGDELNGIEIVRRLINRKLKLKRGSLIAVPIVNVYGVLNQSRYLPDRRDLNRSFPGSAKSSLAGRVANLLMQEVISKCNYGIDLHTGAIHRSNLPQIRADLADPETLEMAKAFGVSALLHSNTRDGSLRQAATDFGAKTLLYEAGEALRFDEFSIRAGVSGVLNVLAHLEMVKKRKQKVPLDPCVTDQSAWFRAPCSGIVRHIKKLGDTIKKNEILAEIGDPTGQVLERVVSNRSGIIIGKQNIPLVQEGDAMYHIAFYKEPGDVTEHMEQLHDVLLPDDDYTLG